MYIIKRTDQGGGFLATPGSAHSYTHNLAYAQGFRTRDDALAQCCENEVPVSVDNFLPRVSP